MCEQVCQTRGSSLALTASVLCPVHKIDECNSGQPGLRLRKTAFLRHLYIKTNILPRQARDKHRENSKKDAVFRTPSPDTCVARPQ